MGKTQAQRQVGLTTMKRPNAIVAMTVGGSVAGAVLGAIYGALALAGIALLDGYWSGFLGGLFFAGGIGGAIGAPLGTGLGFLSGFALDWRVRRMQLPYTDASIVQLRREARLILLILAGAGAAIGLGRFFALMGGSFMGIMFFILLPALISTVSSMWVAEQYLKRLADWGTTKRKGTPNNLSKQKTQLSVASRPDSSTIVSAQSDEERERYTGR